MSAESVAAQLPPPVVAALERTPAAPLLAQSPEQILATLGLPALPQLPPLPPMPGLPVLPTLDPAALLAPVTTLFSGFGNGDLGASGALDPTTVLQSITQSLGTAMQLATAGIQLLQSMQSAGAESATTSAVQTLGSSTALAGQSTRMTGVTAGAAGSVATGYFEMAAVATRFAITTAALGPTLVTPPGQAALLASALEASTQATVITARTKSQLLARSGEMTEAGQPVPVRKPRLPKGVNLVSAPKTLATTTATPPTMTPLTTTVDGAPARAATASATSGGANTSQVLTQLVSLVQPLLSTAQTVGTQIVGQVNPVNQQGQGNQISTTVRPTAPAPVPGAPIVAGHSVTPVQLGAWQAETIAATATSTTPGTLAGPARMVGEVLPPYLPGSPITARSHVEPAAVTASPELDHGDELLGAPPDSTATPVIGALPPERDADPFTL
ncbi:hypothetical protein [Nocardia gipuzkoensis]